MVKIKDNWIRMNETMENGKVFFFFLTEFS
jgi:hypothetical protein